MNWKEDALDHALTDVRDGGVQHGAFTVLLRGKAAGWVSMVARSGLRHFPSAQKTYEVEDVEQVVRQAIWQALVKYRYLCGRCWASPSRKKRAKFDTRAAWAAHVQTHGRNAPASPLIPVGRFVRLSVRQRMEMALRATYAKRRRAVEVDIDDLVVEQLGGAEYAVLAGELAAEARRVLWPAAEQALVRLLEGHTRGEAAAMEGDCGAVAAAEAERFARFAAQRLGIGPRA